MVAFDLNISDEFLLAIELCESFSAIDYSSQNNRSVRLTSGTFSAFLCCSESG